MFKLLQDPLYEASYFTSCVYLQIPCDRGLIHCHSFVGSLFDGRIYWVRTRVLVWCRCAQTIPKTGRAAENPRQLQLHCSFDIPHSRRSATLLVRQISHALDESTGSTILLFSLWSHARDKYLYRKIYKTISITLHNNLPGHAESNEALAIERRTCFVEIGTGHRTQI